jgi:hypothetical protein
VERKEGSKKDLQTEGKESQSARGRKERKKERRARKTIG